ncbi:hypothetical protein SPSIL_026330 [Sporomusa silvacetica DSM 10669]|uniref:Phage tail collar domain-containing protein n=1 Tax=Sporomusa silvacetica DSM 10669 TaxID=1123289 RepID=A0ABZ3IM38_9FIRM|nr:tail fiber protein [Sporomusa silvacetica]OZC22990.1 phage tail collar domain protein [Sporomusa silvacetica DSM 10669]
MACPFIGEIRIFAGSFAPYGWFFCQGQEVAINQYNALYSIVGTLYGTTTNPSQTFKLPDLRGYAPLGWGNGPGLTPQTTLGQTAGSATVTLSHSQMPNHNHTVQCTTNPGTVSSPANGIWAKSAGATLYSVRTPDTQMAAQALQTSGGNTDGSIAAHNNMQPYLGINFIINYDGEYLPRPS